MPQNVSYERSLTQKKIGACPSLKETKEIQQPNAMCHLWLDPGLGRQKCYKSTFWGELERLKKIRLYIRL